MRLTAFVFLLSAGLSNAGVISVDTAHSVFMEPRDAVVSSDVRFTVVKEGVGSEPPEEFTSCEQIEHATTVDGDALIIAELVHGRDFINLASAATPQDDEFGLGTVDNAIVGIVSHATLSASWTSYSLTKLDTTFEGRTHGVITVITQGSFDVVDGVHATTRVFNDSTGLDLLIVDHQTQLDAFEIPFLIGDVIGVEFSAGGYHDFSNLGTMDGATIFMATNVEVAALPEPSSHSLALLVLSSLLPLRARRCTECFASAL